ncbi:MAG: prohibitin family protein [bacterium]|nr:prohibitin family protein [bacterium]
MLFFLVLLVVIGLFIMNKVSKTGVPKTARTGAIAALILIAVLSCFTVIPAGHVGVVDFFGHVSKRTVKAGINLVNPLARIVKFSVKTQEAMEVMDVPSKEGLNIKLDVSVLYHLDPEKAAEVYKTVGKDYAEIILIPQFRSVARGVTASYEAKALYTSEREMVSTLIKKDLEKIVSDRGVVVESVPMRRIILPAGLSQSIEQKLQAEQESQRMQFVLLKEKQEAERKKIEAQGIADFQSIVTRGISEPLLRWKGIEATEKLANSQNTKVIIVGAGKDGLPLIMDTK